MENTEYQNVTVSMPYLISTMSPALTASENDSPYSVHNLLEHDGLMSVNGELFGHALLHGLEHSSSSSSSSSLQAHSPIQWFDPSTLSGLCFLSTSSDAQQQQQLQQQSLGQQQQLQQQQQQQHYQQQQAPLHYSLPPQNYAMQQQHHQFHLEQQQHLYTEKGIGSPEMRSSPSLFPTRDLSSTSMISLPCHHPTKVLLNRPVMPVDQLSMEFSTCRSVFFDRLSSPEETSPIPDQAFFDMTTDDETASGCYSPMLMSGEMYPNTNHKNDTIAMEHLNISGSTSTSSIPQRRRRIPPSLDHKSTPTATLEQIMLFSPNATAALTVGPVMLSPSLSSSSSSSLLTMPALSSPLKQHFSFSTSSSDSDSREEEKEGVRVIGSSSSSPSTSAAAPAKKRRERKPSKSGQNKPKHPPIKLPCLFPGCKTICSSLPSLSRHAEAHRWRGLYAPVRCEACQSALSNEFSVQRHIVRSQLNSRCRRLRVYSIMMSETEIETSVRFYPKRAHGKKTVEIDLNYARARYLGDSPQ
ncbi:hypothetical protein BGZ47_001705 [Haplosporangium gracile]|nr:hypothetical protein BGZ47_001705 [Haplosporangium gracile]